MDLYIYGKSSDTWPDLVCPPTLPLSITLKLAGRHNVGTALLLVVMVMATTITMKIILRRRREIMLKTKTKPMTMMMVVMTLTRPVLLSITLKVVGQRNLGRGGPVRAPRLGISHHPGLPAGHL